jgi:hypothetical protein
MQLVVNAPSLASDGKIDSLLLMNVMLHTMSKVCRDGFEWQMSQIEMSQMITATMCLHRWSLTQRMSGL